MTTPRRPSHTAALILSAALAICVCVAGCYKRTVSARGFGADSAKIEQGNLRDPNNNTLGYKTIQMKSIPPQTTSTTRP